MRLAVTGGGSGGHIFPALAVAKLLQEAGHEVFYVGAAGGMEAELAPEHGVPFYALPAGKYNRGTLQPREAYKALRGLWAARRLLGRLRPNAVLTTGGFAGFPFAFVAERARVPVVLLEQNAVLGLANRWLAPRAVKIALATSAELPPRLARKALVTGMPVREIKYDVREARARLGFDANQPLLVVMGGSQGSLALNRLLPPLLAKRFSGWQILHQTGKAGFEEAARTAEGLENYRTSRFIDAPLAWSAADAAVTRAGATTLAEAAFYQVPLLAIPLPASIDGGAQRGNAAFYASRGAALVADQNDEASVARALDELAKPEVRKRMSSALAGVSPAGAGARLAQILLEVAS